MSSLSRRSPRLVLTQPRSLLYKQWCRMTAEWNNLTTQGQLAVYESIVEDESTRHTVRVLQRSALSHMLTASLCSTALSRARRRPSCASELRRL